MAKRIAAQSFIETISKIISISNESLSYIVQLSNYKSISEDEYWLKSGQTCTLTAYIWKGYLRKYYIIEDGREVTDFFYFEDSFTGDLPAILSGQPTYASVKAMEESQLLVWNYKKLRKMASKSHEIEHLLRVMTERGFITFYNRAKSFITQTPLERYKTLIENNPEVLERSKQYHVASYLGITPQHLSRLKQDL